MGGAGRAKGDSLQGGKAKRQKTGVHRVEELRLLKCSVLIMLPLSLDNFLILLNRCRNLTHQYLILL